MLQEGAKALFLCYNVDLFYMDKKICTRCRDEKPIEGFRLRKGYKGGRDTWCSSCRYAYNRQWLKSNPKNQENARKATLKWYKEQGREWHAQWRDENREKVREINRRSAALHLEDRRERYRLRRAAIDSTTSDITVDWLKQLQSITPKCELCECELLYGAAQHDHKKANLDHIIPLNVGGTHTRDNVRYICYLCNLRRPKNGAD